MEVKHRRKGEVVETEFFSDAIAGVFGDPGDNDAIDLTEYSVIVIKGRRARKFSKQDCPPNCITLASWDRTNGWGDSVFIGDKVKLRPAVYYKTAEKQADDAEKAEFAAIRPKQIALAEAIYGKFGVHGHHSWKRDENGQLVALFAMYVPGKRELYAESVQHAEELLASVGFTNA